MKKLMILLLLVGIVSLYALESDPSDTVGFVKYSCVTTAGTNLNFIALPMDAGYANASDLGNAIGTDICDAIGKWDPATQSWSQASYVAPMGWGGDFALQDGYSYMVSVTAATDIFIAGGMITQPNYNLVTTTGTNLNTLMVPLNRSDLTMASQLGDDIGNTICDAVGNWDASTQSWSQASYVAPMGWGGDFAITIGQPLLVSVKSDTVWPTTAKTLQKSIKHQNLR